MKCINCDNDAIKDSRFCADHQDTQQGLAPPALDDPREPNTRDREPNTGTTRAD